MRPDICSVRCLAIAIPKPVPPRLRPSDESACENLSNSCLRNAGGMPQPVVDHADAAAAVAGARVDFHAAAGARELGSVGQQVRHDLVKAAVVHADQRAGRALPRLDNYAQSLRVVSARGDAAIDQVVDREAAACRSASCRRTPSRSRECR